MPVCKLMPGELCCEIHQVIDRHYFNLKEPKPNDVVDEIYSIIFPHLKLEVQKLQAPTFGRKWRGAR